MILKLCTYLFYTWQELEKKILFNNNFSLIFHETRLVLDTPQRLLEI